MHHLLRIASEGGEREIPVDRDYLIIGRDPSACHLLLDDDVVSRRHAALELDAQGNVTIVDLVSTNGTFVNGAAVDRRVLKEGDTISLGPVGQVDLRYSISPVAPAGETVRLPPTGERAVMLPDGAQTFAAPAETVPLANLPIPPPFKATMNEQEQKQEGRAVGSVCATCSSPLEAGGTFCSSCGAPASQVTTVICPQCGQSVGARAKFCKYCAHKLTDLAPGAVGVTYVSASPQPVHAPAAAPQLTPRAPALASLPSVGVGGQQPVVVAESYSSQSRPAAVPQAGLTSAPHYAPTLTPPVPAQHTTQAASGNGGALLTPTGAGIAAICFFLPWVQFSCGGYSRSVSGADIANRDGSLWIVLGAAVVILGTYFIFKAQRRLAASRPLTLISSLAGGALLIFKGIEFSQPQQTMFGTISPRDLGLSIQPGALGTLGGLGLAFLGALLTRAASRGSPMSPPMSQTEGVSRGDRHQLTGAAGSAPAARAGMKPNVIGMLCYAGLPLLGILWMAAAAVMLAAEPHRRDRFVRFHVFQTLFLGAALFALSMFFLLVGVAGGGLLVLMAGIGPCAFLAYKAYTNETPRLPLVGDLAAKLADQGGGTPRPL